MDLIVFERKAFEEFATKIEQFILRVSNSPVVKGGRKKTNNWWKKNLVQTGFAVIMDMRSGRLFLLRKMRILSCWH